MSHQGCEPLPILRIGQAATTEPDCAKEQAARKLLAEFGPAVVQVKHSRGKGSGFFVEDGSRVVTNFHVVGTSNGLITVETFDNKKVKARIEKIDDINDLAVLKLEGDARHSAVLKVGSSQTLKPGEPVFALGHPGGRPDTYISPGVFNDSGTVSKLIPHTDNKDLLQIKQFLTASDPRIVEDANAYKEAPKVMAEAQIEPGSSGGPLINEKGEVVAVAQLSRKYSYDVPSEKVQELLNSANKFHINYHHTPYLFQHPIRTVASTASMAGLASLPKSGGAILGVLSTVDLLGMATANDGAPLTENEKVRQRLQVGADVAVLSGSTMAWIPKLKSAGKYGLALGVALTAAQSLIPQLELKDITRADGTKRLPFLWNHHFQ